MTPQVIGALTASIVAVLGAIGALIGQIRHNTSPAAHGGTPHAAPPGNPIPPAAP